MTEICRGIAYMTLFKEKMKRYITKHKISGEGESEKEIDSNIIYVCSYLHHI